jgi:predicted dehydrogenase
MSGIRKLRVGIIGFGFIGPLHLDAIRRLGYAEITALATSTAEGARAKADAHHVPRAYGDWRDLVADSEIDVVDIATPTASHANIALASIAAGKHVVVDKPMALNACEAMRMRDAATAAGVFNAVTFSIRYNVMLEQLRALIAQQALGDIRYVHGHYLQEWLLHETDVNWRIVPEKAGRLAMVADAGSHWYDLAQHLTGRRIVRVLADLSRFISHRRSDRAEGGASFPVEVPDLGIVLCQFDNGARASFSTGAIFAGHKNDLSIEINGAVASARWRQEQPDELWIGHRDVPNQVFLKDPALLAPGARALSRIPGGHYEAWTDAFRNLMDRILGSIASGRAPTDFTEDDFPTFETGLRISLICDAIERSAASGGVWTEVGPT